jgi:DNA-binding NarL/FixJ family response regulator
MESFEIAIVDDKAYNIEVLAEKLSLNSNVKIVCTANNGVDFLEKIAELKPKPSLVFMDIDMPEMDGITAVRFAKKHYPEIHFIMNTVFDDDERIFSALQAGASGYLLKDESVQSILFAVECVEKFGAAPLSPSLAKKAYSYIQKNQVENQTSDPNPLSDRETLILKALAEGKSYMVIAEENFISPHTVRKHMTNIYEKLHVNSKVQAINQAVKNRWF